MQIISPIEAKGQRIMFKVKAILGACHFPPITSLRHVKRAQMEWPLDMSAAGMAIASKLEKGTTTIV